MKKFWVAGTVSANYFVGKDHTVSAKYSDAITFNTIADCMKECIYMNEQFGKPVFKVFGLY